jgi:hypothetical protein
MYEPWLILVWALAGLPILSIRKKFKLSKKKWSDYSYCVQWAEFPLLKISIAKIASYSLLGLASIMLFVPFEKVVIGLVVIGACGVVLETSVCANRPKPTRGYVQRQILCERCRSSVHDNCTNVRMLDGFETNFGSKDGFYRPVCCCGFRTGVWQDIPV